MNSAPTFTLTTDAPISSKVGLLAIGVHEGRSLSGVALRADKALDGLLSRQAEHFRFTGKAGRKLVLHTHDRLPAEHVVLIGLGPKKGFGLEEARRSGGSVVRIAAKVKAASVAAAMPLDAANAQGFFEGVLLAGYRFDRYRASRSDAKETPRLEDLALHCEDPRRAKALAGVLPAAAAFADAAAYARDLVNTPASDMSPRHLVAEAEGIANASARVKLKVFGRSELERMGCGGILGIAQGSEEEPYLVHLAYRPTKKARRRVVLVGKGVTFDSGGLSIKPSNAMEDMKIDMGGAAAVYGVFRALPKLLPDVEVHGIAALVENMPSGKAVRPGDIVKTMSGKTIEILNTDAEGRVTMADSLFYGSKLKPDMMIDLATLTGACMVALGQDYAGLMTDHDRLAKRLQDASAASGERLWRLPLAPEYADEIKSRHADVKNIGTSRYGGAITAGLFLKEFVPKGIPWAHLDIAGPAYAQKESLSYHAWGASGYGARLLLHLITSL